VATAALVVFVYGILIAYLLIRGGVFLFGRASLASGAGDT